MTELNNARVSVENGIVVTLDEEETVLPNGHLLIEHNRIAHVTSSNEVLRQFGADKRIEAKGKIVLPGFSNAHMHTRPMRAFADGRAVMDWHGRYADSFSEHMTPHDAFHSAQLAFVECLKSGVTAVNSMAVFPEEDARAAELIGIKARIAPMSETVEEVEKNLKELLHAKESRGRAKLWLGIENPGLFDDETLKDVKQASESEDVGIHTHLSEHVADDAQRLKRIGFLNPRLVLAHCVNVSDQDISAIAKSGSKVAHCPKSNARFGNGIAPVPKMLAAGVCVALGTDGGLNTVGREDMLEEMRLATLLQRGSKRDPPVLSSRKALQMCCRNGSKALGLDSSGQLKAGAAADLAMLDARRPNLAPLILSGPDANLMAIIVQCASASDVNTVLVDGNTVVENCQVLNVDESRLRTAVQNTAERILAKMN